MASVIRGAILRTQSDERLVALARTGHKPAFEAIVERYRPELTRSLRRLLPPGSVEDALQQTHLQAWKALVTGTDVRELRAWLHRIARNAGIAVATRGYEYDELQDALLVTPGPEVDLERREAVRRALRGIAALPERQRAALLAVAVGGRSHAEIALDLGITDTAARQLLHRARVALLAVASFATPPQLVHWAAGGGHSALAGKAAVSSSKVAGTGLGGGVAASATKIGAIVVTIGGVAAGIGPLNHAFTPPGPAVAQHKRHVHTAHARVHLAAVASSRPAVAVSPQTVPAPATSPAPARPVARRPASHHVRRVSTRAVGKLAPPAPITPAATSAPVLASAPVTPAAVTPSTPTPSLLAVLAAWWYAHRASIVQSRSNDGAVPTGDAGTAATACAAPGRASTTPTASASTAGPSSGACDHSNKRRGF